MPNFAGAQINPGTPDDVRGASDIEALAEAVAADLDAGRNVALGFEAPQFIPVPTEASDLCRGRRNEGSRSFAAPAGLAVAGLGIHQAAWVLRRVAEHCRSVRFGVNPSMWPPCSGDSLLFCWEAFVSGDAHSDSHIRDAATAAIGFLHNERNLAAATTVTTEHPLSLIAAAALWSGLTIDVGLLHDATAVIRPAAAYMGEIQAA